MFGFNATNNRLFISFTGNKIRKKRDPDPAFTVRVALVTSPIPEEDHVVEIEEV